MNIKTNKKIIIAIAAVLVIFPVFVSAYTLLQPLPGGGQALEKDVSLPQYLNWLFRFILAAGAFLAVLKIVIGAMHIMVGGASESSVTKGREMISMAIWGVLLAISSVLILGTINPDLIKTGLTVPDIKIKSGKSSGGPAIMNVEKGGCCVKSGWTATQCEYVESSDACEGGSFQYLQPCDNFSGCEKKEKKMPGGFRLDKVRFREGGLLP